MDPQPQPCRRFVKTILDFFIQLKKLRLPFKFVRFYEHELADSVKLFTPDTRVWEMKVVREEGLVWLDTGFHEFSQLYSLKHGHQVHFKYKGMSNFSVRIFDKSCCQIAYPPLADASPAPPRPQPKPRKPYSRNKRYDLCDYRSENGFQSPRHFKSARPHFIVKLQACNLRLNILFVPIDFSKKHMAGTRAQAVKLETIDGRQWEVALKRKKMGRFNFGKGWKTFHEENNLKEGDVCIFERLKKSAFVFKVYIFVAI